MGVPSHFASASHSLININWISGMARNCGIKTAGALWTPLQRLEWQTTGIFFYCTITALNKVIQRPQPALFFFVFVHPPIHLRFVPRAVNLLDLWKTKMRPTRLACNFHFETWERWWLSVKSRSKAGDPLYIPNVNWRSRKFPRNRLVMVSLHQSNPQSPDVSFQNKCLSCSRRERRKKAEGLRRTVWRLCQFSKKLQSWRWWASRKNELLSTLTSLSVSPR